MIGDAVVEARVAVVAAAGWTAGLLEPDVALALVPPITVTAETVAWFRPTTGPWPSFIQRGDTLAYGLGSPDGLVKAGLHGTGPVIDPDARPSRVPGAVEAIEDYARHWLPGVDPAAVRRHRVPACCRAQRTTSCSTAGDSVVVGVGFGGHGFKFTPAIGERLADLTPSAWVAVRRNPKSLPPTVSPAAPASATHGAEFGQRSGSRTDTSRSSRRGSYGRGSSTHTISTPASR